MRIIDADALCVALDDFGEHCYKTGREEMAGIIFALTDVVRKQPTINRIQMTDYRVPSTEEWMERYCTKKRFAGYQKQQGEGRDESD